MVIESLVCIEKLISAVGIAGLKGELVVPVVFRVFIPCGPRLGWGKRRAM